MLPPARMTLLTSLPLVLAGVLSFPTQTPAQVPAQVPAREADLRDGYDVLTYRLDLRVDPEQEVLYGTVAVELRVVALELSVVELDMRNLLEPERVHRTNVPLTGDSLLDGERLRFRHADDRLSCLLPEAATQGDVLTVVVRYRGEPTSHNGFDGFHWERSEAGQPWLSTSFQGIGAHGWWPCKASFFNPEDKHERLFVNATVPPGLTAVSNGVLESREPATDGWSTFRWRHDYPCPTYSVCLNVGPFEIVETQLELRDVDQPVPFIYYVLPEDLEKARLQFADVPRFLDVMSQAFGPWPYPAAKVSLVQTSFWGMEHSTAIAYGSSFPAWIAEHGADAGVTDPFASRNRFFDYILVHELAHEWWGNGVSASDWGDFWLHEGFATYAEGVYVEHLHGRDQADEFFDQQRRFTHPKARLYRGRGTNSRQAYNSAIYSKGACVLNTLRHYVDDDEAWWNALRAFNLAYRYDCASTEDFRAVLEAETQRSWERFFEQWVYGAGYPELRGSAHLAGGRIKVEVSNPEVADTAFHVPLDLAWRVGEQWHTRRVMLEPGDNSLELDADPAAEELRILHLDRVLGRHDVRVR